MDWLQAPDYWLTRLLIERALGMIYLVAFLVAAFQFRPLLGAHGLLPVPLFLRRVRFLDAPTLFHLHYSDPLLLAVAWGGVLLSIAVVVGLPDVAPPAVAIPIWFALWALYQSIVNVGQIFYAFGWETLLLEAGFLAIFLGAGPTVPPWPLILLLRWLVFRVEFGAGLIKLRGDRCWREGTCLYYHHETQPMPNSLSWFFHHLPRPLHRIEVLGNFFAQLVLAGTVLVIVLSYRPVLNLISPHQLMNFSFDPFHLVNTYGAFGSVTKERYEIVVEGTADHPLGEAGWKAYEFKGKPGDPRR